MTDEEQEEMEQVIDCAGADEDEIQAARREGARRVMEAIVEAARLNRPTAHRIGCRVIAASYVLRIPPWDDVPNIAALAKAMGKHPTYARQLVASVSVAIGVEAPVLGKHRPFQRS